MKTDFHELTQKVIAYCNDRGWKVHIGKYESRADPEGNEILLSMWQTDEFLFYTFLHEVGHMIIAGRDNYWEKYPGLLLKESNKKYRMDYLEHEMEAWRCGLDLSGELGIESFIDLKKWNNLRWQCLYSYTRWTVDPSRYEI